MALSLSVYKNRTSVFSLTVNGADGNPETFAIGDNFRVKIGRSGETPLLDLTSDSPSSNGSSLTAANPTIMTLDQGDLNLLTPGVYDVEAAIVDATTGKIKHAEEGVIVVHTTQLGGIAV